MAETLQGLKVYPTYELLERTDPGEWEGLDTGSKELYQIIISAGKVCLTDGTQVRNFLLTLFPEGTITGNKIRLM
jgi:hypothetical protein